MKLFITNFCKKTELCRHYSLIFCTHTYIEIPRMDTFQRKNPNTNAALYFSRKETEVVVKEKTSNDIIPPTLTKVSEYIT